jgi:hypothetical protein
MAIQALNQIGSDSLPTVEEVMVERGFDRFTAELYLAGLRGDGLINDRICVPIDQREQVLRELQEAEDAYYAAVEEGAKHLDLSATLEENMTRTGLDRHAVEVYLEQLRGEEVAAESTE